MANGLITSFFTTSTSSRVEQTTEGEGPARKIPFDGVSDNGLTLDLGGFLCSDSMEVQPKGRKKKKRKRGHVHLARLSEDDNYVAIEQNEDDVLCEEVTIVDPDEEGVVWLSPLKQKAPLSLPWQHVFRHTQRKSPVKKTASSPKRCRSPRQPTQVKQSPSEQAVKRQLLSTPGNSRIACLPVDYAPYTGLVHVQQRQQQGAGGGHTATANSSIVPLSFRLPLRAEPQSCPTTVGATWSLESGDCHPVSPTMPSFEPVTDRLAACLDQMERESPHLNVSDIYSRYSSLTKRSHRLPDSDSLTCSITVRVSDDRVTVDPSAYPRDAELHDHMHSDLWSVIYRPRRSSEVIGNSAPCSSLCTWLNRWKAERSTGEAAGSRKGAETDLRHRSKLHNSNGWWMSDRDDDFIPPDQSRPRKKSGLAQRYLDGDIDAVSTEEEDLCSVMLLCGPPGSGKTAAVYACAEELGFGVFEVNSSCGRGRAQMLSTLREVTLSHLVAQRKRNGLAVMEGEPKAPQTVSLENNTLILLDEVDVLFEEEERGFWSAVYEIVRSTKRPFVMTCSDDGMELACPHSRLHFSRPLASELAIHIRLLSLAHGVSLSSAAANQIASSLNSDIRKTFHFMHTWLSGFSSSCDQSSGNPIEAPPLSSNLFPPRHLSTEWRISPVHSSVKVHPDPSDLFTAAADADEQATLDLLNQTEGIDLDPWWRVAPVNYLLDEPSITAPIDNVLTQTKADIAMEFSRLVGLKPHHKQSFSSTLHTSLKNCSEAFSPSWRLAHVAIATEGLPLLRLMSILEEQRRALCSKRRFHYYLKQIDVSTENLGLLANTNFV